MEGDGLRAEGEFLVLCGLCREQLENRVLETALVSLCTTRENHEGGEKIYHDSRRRTGRFVVHDAVQAELWSFPAVRFHS